MLGQVVVHTIETSDKFIDLKPLPQGIYIVKLSDNDTRASKSFKIIKQ